MAHETDYQRARRQRIEVKKYGVTGSTPRDAMRRIKEHTASKSIDRHEVKGIRKALTKAMKD